jgi:hypothetical protein
MSENPMPTFSGIGILGNATERTTYDQILQLKFNPTYKKCGVPPDHTYEAFRKGENYVNSTSTLRQGQTNKPIQAYAIGRDGILYPEVVMPRGGKESYKPATIYDDPYQPYSYYTTYTNTR